MDEERLAQIETHYKDLWTSCFTFVFLLEYIGD